MVQVYIVYIETSGDVVYTVFLHHNWFAKVIQDIVRSGKFGMTPFTEGPCSPSVTSLLPAWKQIFGPFCMPCHCTSRRN